MTYKQVIELCGLTALVEARVGTSRGRKGGYNEAPSGLALRTASLFASAITEALIVAQIVLAFLLSRKGLESLKWLGWSLLFSAAGQDG